MRCAKFLLATIVTAGGAFAAMPAGLAQPYPAHAVKIIVPTPAAARSMWLRGSSAIISASSIGQTGGGRQPARRRQHHRLEGSRAGRARRLHAALFERERAGARAHAAEERRLRPADELRSDRAGGAKLDHPGGASFGAGQNRAGTRRLRQGQSRQGELLLGRHRRAAAPDRRMVQVGGRDRHRARAVPGWRPVDQRSRRRPGADDLRGHQRAGAAHSKPASSGRSPPPAPSASRNCPDLPTMAESGYPRLRVDQLDRAAGAGAHARAR